MRETSAEDQAGRRGMPGVGLGDLNALLPHRSVGHLSYESKPGFAWSPTGPSRCGCRSVSLVDPTRPDPEPRARLLVLPVRQQRQIATNAVTRAGYETVPQEASQHARL
jgi:hypothetical protein